MLSVTGSVRGGALPVQHASVQLYAIGAGAGNANSLPLLEKPVLTDGNGKFSTGSIECPSATSQTYIVSTGGHSAPEATVDNPAIALMAVTGPCGNLSQAAIDVDESTTVASIWPLASVMRSASTIQTASASQVESAFGDANDLMKLRPRAQRVTADAATTTAKLSSLANILASCVDSATDSACAQLFSLAASRGGATPTDTIAAALAIVQHPARNTAELFNLGLSHAPFQPALQAAPLDWTLQATTQSALTPVASLHAASALSAPASLNVATPAPADGTSTPTTLTVLPFVRVAITPGVISLGPGQNRAFKATVNGSSDTNVVWTVSPALGRISPAGLYTAPGAIPTTQLLTVTARVGSSKVSFATAKLMLTAPPSVVPTYYVDQVNGRDSNLGTTVKTAFATIAKVNSLALKAGQTVAFRAGQEWHDTLLVNRSGTAAAPITYTTYGSGTQAVISAADPTASWTKVADTVWSLASPSNPAIPVLEGQPGIRVGSLASVIAPRNFYWDGKTLFVYSVANPSATVEIPRRLYAVTSTGAGFITFSGLQFRGALNYDVYVSCATMVCTNWTFAGDTFSSSFSNELYFNVPDSTKGAPLTVIGSTFASGGSSGIKMSGGLVGNIVDNSFTDLCSIYDPLSGSLENSYCDAIYGFSLNGQSQAGTYVALNSIQNIGLGQTTQLYGGGIHADTVTGWDIEENSIVNTEAPGINLEKGKNSTVQYNLMVKAGFGLYQSGIMVRAADATTSYQANGDATNQTVKNNTVAPGSYWGCNLQLTQNSGYVAMTHLVFQNNICSVGTASQALWADVGTNDPTNLLSGNSFGAAAPYFAYVVGQFPASYSSVDSSWGRATNSIPGDPQFKNPAAGDYSILTTSPAAAIGAQR